MIVALCFGIASSIASALSNVTWHFYLAAVVGMGFYVFKISLKLFYTKLVEAEERAKANSIDAAITGSFYIGFAALFHFLYKLTVNYNPAIFYFVSVVFLVIAMIATLFLNVINRSASVEQGEVRDL